jgi:hypothetical protein
VVVVVVVVTPATGGTGFGVVPPPPPPPPHAGRAIASSKAAGRFIGLLPSTDGARPAVLRAGLAVSA